MAISFRAKTHSLTASPGDPGGGAGDDLFIWGLAATGPLTGPAGWSTLATFTGVHSVFVLWWIKRGGSAPSFVWTGGSGFMESSCLAYQGRVSSSTPLVVANAAHQINPQNPDCPAALSALAGSMILAFGGSWTGSVGSVWAAPASYTIREDGGGTVGNDIMMAERLLLVGGIENPAAFSNGSATLDDVAEVTITLPADPTGGFSIPRIQPALPGSPFYQAWITRPQPLSSSGTPLNNYVLAAVIGVYTYTGSAASTLATRLLAAVTGIYTYAGSAASTLTKRLLAAATGVYTLTGAAALLARGLKLFTAVGTYALTGSAATLLATRLLSAVTGVYSVTGKAASTLAKRLLTTAVGAFTLTGSAIQIARTYVLGATRGVFSVTGNVASLIYSAATSTASDWIVRMRRRRR